MSLEAILKYPIVFLTGAILALLMTRLWGARASRWGLIDLPGPRKIHQHPIPLAGGIAIFLAFHGACAVVFLMPWQPFAGQVQVNWWWRFIPLSIAILALGLGDDRFDIKPVIKLSAQIAIAVAAYGLNLRVQNVLGYPLPGYLDFAATIAWFLILMNSFNLIDGVDGLAAGIALLASIGIAVSLVFRNEPGDVLLFLGFAGACAGFLRYNFHPARVFLGDGGSLFIGFTLAALSISTNAKGPTLAAIGMPLLAVGVPVFDTMLAVWRRAVRRFLLDAKPRGILMGLDQADGDHLHHRLLRGGRKHRQVAMILYAATAVLAALGILASIFHDRAKGILGLSFLVGAYTIVRHLAWIELRDTGETVLKGITRPVRRNQTLLFYVVCDVLILNATLLFVSLLFNRLELTHVPEFKRLWLWQAPLDVGLPFMMLVLARSYSRVWYLARISEYITTGMAVVLGYALALSIQLIGLGALGLTTHLTIRYLLLTGLAAPLIVGLRASLRVVQDLLHWLRRGLQRDNNRGVRTLICGAGYRTTLFLRQHAYADQSKDPLDIIGLAAWDTAVLGHFVHGIPVIGTLNELPYVLKERRIEKVYIVEELEPAQEQQVRQAVEKTGIRLIRWNITETDLAPINPTPLPRHGRTGSA